ncbi:MAG: chitobiase/beta-hexosaminidase C-terminal domain-containing protein, partial [Marinilabiliales bacterium]|nr:chitobiase/beta-hexosaminidase C-terminal domain-containing protein [Marinilabiliales bacterium]
NGSEYLKSFISHQTILKGGAIHFEMGARPNPKWGTASQDRLHTRKLAETVQKPYCRIAENYFFDRAKVTLGSETPGAKIYYTLDGSTPSKGSLLFRSPFQIDQTTVIRYFACREGLQPSSEVSSRLEKLEPIPLKVMTDYSRQPLAPGLQYKYFEEHIMKVDELDQLIPKKRGIVDGLSIAPRDQDALFAFIWEGLIRIPTDGVYTFYLSCNDGGVLYLDGQRFIDQDGPHTAVPMEKTVLLKAGIYRIGEKYFQMGGAFSNQVLWKGPGIRKGEIPATVLFHPVHP